uniref:Cytochrome b n=1 Tax=Seison sp. MS-2015 TaxID=1673261 RepID=A0A678NKZ1_9BILA|nr:cytochrome b [Seison sp. MS-2015]
MLSIRKKHSLLKIVNSFLVDLPAPMNFNHFYSFGSILGVILCLQLVTGIFLSFQFTADTGISFESVVHMMRDVNWGWLLRVVHANGASLFFLFVYIHMGRGLYYGSYNLKMSWNMGVVIYVLLVVTAFLGYVLPWGQMSFWAATVIINLVSAIPYLGTELVEWVWGGFGVSNPTLVRFFSFHYVLPFVVLVVVCLHCFFLHVETSTNPLGVNSKGMKVSFHVFYSYKDIFGFTVVFFVLLFIVLFYPFIFMDPENFIPANPMVTPVHIQPEWYFLFIYAMLRCIPSKLGGFVVVILAIVVFLCSHVIFSSFIWGVNFFFVGKMMFWGFVSNFFMLSWLGSCAVEYPYDVLSLVFTLVYFGYFFSMSVLFYFYKFYMSVS